MVAHTAQPKVLVIDDENLFREMLSVTLADEYEILSANSADRGLRLLREKRPDVVLLDIVMPGRDGIQGLKAIREEDPDVTVIMITGFPRLETAEQAMEFGANYYVEKPIQPDELRRTLRLSVEQTQAHKRQSRAMHELTGMLQHFAKQREEERDIAEQAEAAVELMHDLKFPLTNTLEQLNSLSEKLSATETTEPETKSQLTLIENTIKRCRELTELCRSIGQRIEDRREPIWFAELVSEVVDEFGQWLPGVGVRIDFRLYAKDAWVKGQRTQLRRAIHSAFASAVESMARTGGVVRAQCTEQNSNVVLRIEDHGTGHNLDTVADEVSEQFSRRDLASGAGLGYCLVRKIVEQHGGKVMIQTAEGKGSVTFISLPMQREGTG